jgi:hypothetical protein
MVIRAELFTFAVEHLDMHRQDSDSERIEGQDVLRVLGLAVRLNHPAVHDYPGWADVEGSGFKSGACGAAGPASAPGSAVERPARRTPGHAA